jgi:hypothetical protein
MVLRNEIGGAIDAKDSGIEAPAPGLNRSPMQQYILQVSFFEPEGLR